VRSLIALLAIGVLTASCAASAPPPSPTSATGGRIIEITMKEFGFTPSTITVRPGEKITLRLKNTGMVEHEFMAGLGPIPGRGYADDWIAKAAANIPSHTHPGEEHLGEGVRVSQNWFGSIDLVVPMQTGEYEFGCFVQGHYEAGMKGTLSVR
jgi:uncharacterized cupredoxin-like copper-binding protein